MSVECVDECTKVNAVETFGGVIEDGVVDVVYGCGQLVVGGGKDKFISGPCFAGNNVVGM
jgi:hypothetical protein